MNTRIVLDLILLINLLFLMAFPLFELESHQWAGLLFFVLLGYHHWLNRRWGKGLRRGRWNRNRVMETVVNGGLVIVFLTLLYTGLFFVKRYVPFLPLPGTMMTMKIHHMSCAYLGFLLIAFHLGLHGQLWISLLKKWTGQKPWISKGISYLMPLVTLYGLYAFIHRNWLDYLLARVHFVFLDFQASKMLFFVDHLAILLAVAWIAWRIKKLGMRNGV